MLNTEENDLRGEGLVAFRDSDGRLGVVPKTEVWRTLGATAEELARRSVGRAAE